MSRKVIVIVCLLLAAVFTLLIYRSANVKYAELRKTVDAVKVTQFIPAGSEIRADQVEAVKVPEAVGKEFVNDVNQVVGKAAKVSLVEGQYIFLGSVGDVARKPDMVEVHVPVDLSSSAAVFAGDTADVFAFSKGQQEAPGMRVPASVGLEVSREAAPAIVQAASQKRIYLVKATPAG
ncbi:MAG: SAF domain-containing protein [Armatimonadetes bacterium]|nr:SAF domain-containing protein [Armatimonadota bacterium]